MVSLPSHKGALSAFWRKNASSTEATELANLLRALRKVAGHLGPNVGRIEYMGMSHGESASIVVDPAMVMGKYPVSPEKVDYLVGLVAHESFLRIEWTERVWKLLSKDFQSQDPLERVMFQKIVQTGESIYVDRLADRTIIGRYVVQTRGRALMEARTKLRSEILTLDALVFLWWVSTWQENISTLMEPVYEAPLRVLKTLTQELTEVPDYTTSVTRRCDERAELYRYTWSVLRDVCLRLTLLDRRLVWMESGPAAGPGKRAEAAPAKTRATPLPAGLVREIETELAAHSSDITPLIRNVVGHDHPDVAPTSRWDFNIPAHPVVDRKMVGRLRSIFLNYADRKSVTSRGLTAGKVDGRRLHRAPVNGRCFVQTDRIPSVAWNVTLLLDATGSMQGGKWRMVENTVGNLHRALVGFKNRLSAWAYFEMDGICMVSRLISGRNLLSVPPAGQTASGQALIAAAHFMPNDSRRNLLIHVTDGETNFGVDVEYGIDYCQQRNIHLVTLGCGVKDKRVMEAQYGKTIQFITHFAQLPQAIEKLLKWTFLYGARRLTGEDEQFRKLFTQNKGGHS